MNIWYQNISWYGNLIELIGAIVGILQFLGAEKIQNFSQKFDIRKSEHYIKFTRLNIPIEKNLAEVLPMWKTFSVKMFLPQLVILPFLIIILVITLPVFLMDLAVEGVILKYFGSTIWFIIVACVCWIFLPLIFYVAILILIVLYLPLIILPLLGIYYFLEFCSRLLIRTAVHRERLISLSVGIVLFGLFLQVLGPMINGEVFITRLQNILK